MSCLFNSLSEGLYHLVGKKNIDVRLIITNYMKENLDNTLSSGDTLREWLDKYRVTVGEKNISR